jgi:hypothetical protein
VEGLTIIYASPLPVIYVPKKQLLVARRDLKTLAINDILEE